MDIFCIDIGNTHTHYGIVSGESPTRMEVVRTASLSMPGGQLEEEINRYYLRFRDAAAFAFCSVVPKAIDALRELFRRLDIEEKLFHLTADSNLGMSVSYPQPEEIGQDRLANAVAATAFFSLPTIVVDMGTAVTLDVISHSGGYEGGVIAPGLSVMTQYLNEKTAQLPDIGEDWSGTAAIGKSTRDAMKIGCRVGFGGMINALLDVVTQELARNNENNPTLIATGGSAERVRSLLPPGALFVPDITLRGLAHAWTLNR